jgi:ribosomal protein S18 acetylase RimI-like enzyme
MIQIKECNFNNPVECQAVIELMNHYMTGPMGGLLQAYGPEKEVTLIEGLRKHPAKIVLLAMHGSKYVGLANCFINFGTFAAKPFINIHDIVVHEKYRGQSIGRRLMEEIIFRAKALDCCKITPEVREDNRQALNLYSSLDFKESDPVMHFWTKYL